MAQQSIHQPLYLEWAVPDLRHDANRELILSKEQHFAPSSLYVHKGLNTALLQNTKERNSLSLADDPDITRIAAVIEGHVISNLGTIAAALGTRSFRPSKTTASCVCFKDGAFFHRHADVVHERVGRRRHTWVYYLNTEPKKFQGGELLMFAGGQVAATVEPAHGKLIVFLSETPHEVTTVKLSPDRFSNARLTITGFISGAPTTRDRLVYYVKSFRSLIRRLAEKRN